MQHEQFEREHVQQVYDQISEHFSATRYKPWPLVSAFMSSFPSGCVGCDLGSGNAKNALPFPHLWTLCCDFSEELCRVASRRGALSVQASVLSLPLRNDFCEYVLCIAVLHHLSSSDRRQRAIQEMVRIMKQGAKALVFVWAFEENRNESVYGRRKGARGLVSLGEDGQDVLVPWKRPDGSVDMRYYHLFREGELDSLVVNMAPDVTLLKSGYERDNYYVVFAKT